MVMPNGKPDMDDIEKALMQGDFCDAMNDLDFSLCFFDEDNYPTDFFFLSNDDEVIVLYRQDLKEFWTYPRANNRCINPKGVVK